MTADAQCAAVRIATPRRSILTSICSVAGITCAVRLAGLVEKVILANYFGTSRALDAFTVAFSVPMMAYLMVSAVIMPTFLPVFVGRCQTGDNRGAWSQFAAWGLLIVGVCATVGAAAFFALDPLVKLLAPGFDAETRALCMRMTRLMLPLCVLMGLRPLLECALNAVRQFLPAPLAQFVGKICFIGLLVLMGGYSGPGILPRAAAGGAVAGFLLLAISAGGKCLGFRAVPDFRDPDFRVVLLSMAAPALGAVFSRVGYLAQNAAASTTAGGSIIALDLAGKITDLPLIIVSYACGTVLFTVFSELTTRKDYDSLSELLAKSIRIMIFIFLPLALLTSILAHPIVALVFERGKFGPESTAQVASILEMLSPVMLLYSVEMLLMRHFFARQDYWTPVLIGVASVLARIGLFVFLTPVVGMAAVPGSIVLALGMKVLLLGYFLKKRGRFSRSLGEVVDWRLLPAALLAGGTALVAAHALISPGGVFVRTTMLAATGGVSAAAYFGAAWCMGSMECRNLTTYLFQRIR